MATAANYGVPTAGERLSQAPFSLLNSPALAEARRRYAARNARNQQQRGTVLSQLYGLDPAQQREQLANSQREAAGNEADFLNNSQFQANQDTQNYLRNLYGQERGYEEQNLREARARHEANRSHLGAFFGNLLGTGLGGFLGGAGTRLGSSLFGGGDGGDQQDYGSPGPYFQYRYGQGQQQDPYMAWYNQTYGP